APSGLARRNLSHAPAVAFDRREKIVGLGGNTIDFWTEHPQLRRDDSGLFVASTRYHQGVNLWERRPIGLGESFDALDIAAWAFGTALLLWRGSRILVRRRGHAKIVPLIRQPI